jgi:hypothetical protein
MKNLTVAVPGDVYRQARVRAAEQGTSVSALPCGRPGDPRRSRRAGAWGVRGEYHWMVRMIPRLALGIIWKVIARRAPVDVSAFSAKQRHHIRRAEGGYAAFLHHPSLLLCL